MKWNVVIADDEPVILEGIRTFVEKSGCDCTVTGLAEDGEEAMKLIESLHPDIVISDIQMPGATGLDMIRRWYKKPYCPKFIFISGFHEFEYVQEAIRYDAVDFLLKPVASGDMQRSLKKTIEQLNEQKTMKVFQVEKKDQIQSFFDAVHRGNEYTESEYYRQFEQMGVSLSHCLFLSVCFSIMEQPGQDSARTELVKFIIYDKIAEWYMERKIGFVTKKDKVGCHIMMMVGEEERSRIVTDKVMTVKNLIEHEYNVRLIIGIGEIVGEVSQLAYAFKSARLAREMYYFEEKPLICSSQIHREYTTSFEDYNHAVQAVIESFVSQDGSLEKNVSAVLNCIENLHYGNRQVTVNKAYLFVESVYGELREYGFVNETIAKLREKVMEEIELADTFRQMKEAVRSYMNAYEMAVNEDKSCRDCREIAKVKEYMKQCYNEDITLKKLADMVGMNPAYFSVFFKKNAGENYLTYLQNIRLNEARRLLMKTDMLTYQISDAVGYNTVRRFTEAFKKKYGLNPVEYRKKYSGS